MLNRHGTRLDIGTAEDVAELEMAEARRREAAARNSSPAARASPSTTSAFTSTTVAGGAPASGFYSAQRTARTAAPPTSGFDGGAGGGVGTLFPTPSASTSAPSTRDRYAGFEGGRYRTPSGGTVGSGTVYAEGFGATLAASTGAMATPMAAGRMGEAGGFSPSPSTPSSFYTGQTVGGPAGSGVGGVGSSSSGGPSIASSAAQRAYERLMRQQPQPPSTATGTELFRTPMERRPGAGFGVDSSGGAGGGGNPFEALDRADEEEDVALRRPSRASGRFPPP